LGMGLTALLYATTFLIERMQHDLTLLIRSLAAGG
jgi:hypothetical protein